MKIVRLVALTLFSAAMAMKVAAEITPAVYLQEARNNPYERVIFINEDQQEVFCTAFYRGSSEPSGDISVQFTIDQQQVARFNAAHADKYKALPKANYTITATEGTIKKGAVAADPVKISIRTKGLKAFETYLLPVTVSVQGGAVAADPELSTVYYLIRPVPAPGDAPRKKVGHMDGTVKNMFSFAGKALVVQSPDGTLTSYPYSSSGSLGKGVAVAGVENLKDMDIVVNFLDKHIVGLTRSVGGGQMWGFPISADGRNVAAVEKVFGTSGYNIFSGIIPFGAALYCLKPNGELMLYALTPALEWGSIRSLGGGWNYEVLFIYNNSMIGIDKQGDMWQYALTENGLAGIPKRLGSGWNKFTRIVAMGNDLLALDKAGDVWLVKFNDKGFWAL